MPSQLPRRPRWLALLAVGAVLTGVVLPASAATPSTPAPLPAVASSGLAQIDTARPARDVAAAPAPAVVPDAIGGLTRIHPAVAAAVAPRGIDLPEAPVGSESRVRPKPAAPRASPSRTSAAPTRPSAATVYRGRNHVWMPSIGINRSVAFFPCSRSEPPGDLVYRWGCAGTNNVYLLGHAHSVFEPLHDLYVSGRLRKGMKVIYADGNGRVRTYAVSFWRVVAPDGDIAFAYAAQSRPSMTLQTCVGRRSEKRLVIRLVAVG